MADGLKRRLILAAAALALLLPGFVFAATPPQRIVSLNLCTDQLLLVLSPRKNIAALSFLAGDPQSSAYVAEARGIKLIYGLAEEILPLEPDLVLTGPHTNPATLRMLNRFGHKLVKLPIARTLDEIEANIRIIAGAIGRKARGEEVIAAFRAALPELPPQSQSERPLAALYWANTFSSGRGTLPHEVLTRAGFRNLAAEIGRDGSRQMPMELLIKDRPRVLVFGKTSTSPSIATEIFHHPALKRVFSKEMTVNIPDNLWLCGTPATARAVNLIHRKLAP